MQDSITYGLQGVSMGKVEVSPSVSELSTRISLLEREVEELKTIIARLVLPELTPRKFSLSERDKGKPNV